jgi:hypothetical protein
MGHWHQWGALFYVLPFAEQTSLYDIYSQYVTGTTQPKTSGGTKTSGVGFVPWYTANTNALAALFQSPISFFHCPSDGDSRQMSTQPQQRRNYNICYGDNWTYNYYQSNGIFRGMFGMFLWNNMSACTDGTSNTALMSEQVIGSANPTEIVSVSSASIKSGAIRLNSSAPSSPLTCLGYKNGNDVTGTTFNMWRGNTRFCGRMVDMGFTTVLPPNSPSCAGYNPTSNYYCSGLMSATSNHSGGVQVLRGDGSVSFVNDTIDCGDLTAAAPGYDSGGSPYGVWGALGTRDGGESKKP